MTPQLWAASMVTAAIVAVLAFAAIFIYERVKSRQTRAGFARADFADTMLVSEPKIRWTQHYVYVAGELRGVPIVVRAKTEARARLAYARKVAEASQ